jgi:hypothetical protein
MSIPSHFGDEVYARRYVCRVHDLHNAVDLEIGNAGRADPAEIGRDADGVQVEGQDVMITVAVCASLLPFLRASRLQPMQVLREE